MHAIGFTYFPIKKIMLMDASTRESLGSERIRFDICTILPEILSNGCRSSRQHMNFPRGYFENITQESESTKFLYLHSDSSMVQDGVTTKVMS